MYIYIYIYMDFVRHFSLLLFSCFMFFMLGCDIHTHAHAQDKFVEHTCEATLYSWKFVELVRAGVWAWISQLIDILLSHAYRQHSWGPRCKPQTDYKLHENEKGNCIPDVRSTPLKRERRIVHHLFISFSRTKQRTHDRQSECALMYICIYVSLSLSIYMYIYMLYVYM